MGLSKTFSITGWRLGYAVAPAEMARSLALVNDLFYICAPTPLQHGVAAGFAAPPSFFEDMRRDYQGKRDALCEALDAARLAPIVPQGAYYVLADARHLGSDSLILARRILEEARVGVTPGIDFGARAEGHLRFSYASARDRIEEGLRRLERWLPHA